MHLQLVTASKLLTTHHLITHAARRLISKKIKDQLDYSRYPTLNELDLDEQFIHGSGPGGQAVNKAHNCVLLKHKPTGNCEKCP